MPLPMAVHTQDRLLSLNIHREPGIDLGHLIPGMKLWPLFLDPDNATWVLYAKYAPGTSLPRHFHTGAVHFFTTRGTWGYHEYPEDAQTAGSYLYEPPGTMHTFHIPEDAAQDVEGFMVVTGVNVVFDDAGNYLSTDHAGSMEQIILECARRQGIAMPRYIRPSGPAAYTV
ncbi:2,4'-dihydroxyacetophenone dioxygenase family protein [Novosphingobium sp. H3SJ31-1]|uniref:2,4'-dihydroxyacetophenone dioxygenase family protein n=2 Tax=Novosphingobium album (ex Liu et al. 2023) TaxID=3031130 RepID=A0ABT5WJU3_9SPHN|nr:2,4'-dihydroxyacetophenone dioxygenase family protein [Novosphingobium album (ex Liu et al. 2023)]